MIPGPSKFDDHQTAVLYRQSRATESGEATRINRGVSQVSYESSLRRFLKIQRSQKTIKLMARPMGGTTVVFRKLGRKGPGKAVIFHHKMEEEKFSE